MAGGVIGNVVLKASDGSGRRSWLWAALFATGLELGMLVTPYTSFFGIPMTTRFVIVTFAAHSIFGVALGLAAKWLAARWQFRPVLAD